VLAKGANAREATPPEQLAGDIAAHDPSTIARCGSNYWVFSTGRGILSQHSTNLHQWTSGPRVFPHAPNWTTNMVPGFRGHFWAPDVIRSGSTWLLFYSVSSWGSQTSVIGLATNATLNPVEPGFGWKDCGPVIKSDPSLDFNAIDPSALRDGQGRLWLAFGSYWGGLRVVELDPATGRRLDESAPLTAVAWKPAIEAACLSEHDGFFYLMMNWGRCCQGVASTYNIRVGRSREPTGPFLDREGVDLREGGGTLLLGSEGQRIGPGHAGILRDQGAEWLSYHYYDGGWFGVGTLGLRRLSWSQDGWPEL